jgi:hypothetical protein
MRHFPLRECGYAFVVVALAAVYVGAYYQSVTPSAYAFLDDRGIKMKATYPAEWMQAFFAPVHGIDRELRPDTWTLRFRF